MPAVLDRVRSVKLLLLLRGAVLGRPDLREDTPARARAFRDRPSKPF